jgi:hypothetical protein
MAPQYLDDVQQSFSASHEDILGLDADSFCQQHGSRTSAIQQTNSLALSAHARPRLNAWQTTIFLIFKLNSPG